MRATVALAVTIPKPTPLSQIDREELLRLWKTAREARTIAFGYFNSERERIESEFKTYPEKSKAWRDHLKSVFYAGKDETANINKRKEEMCDSDLRLFYVNLNVRYPWLNKEAWLDSWMSGFTAPTDSGMETNIDKAYTYALRNWFTQIKTSKLSSLRDEVKDVEPVYDPSELTIGALYFYNNTDVFQVTRRTHKGKRTLGVRYGTETEVRLHKGSPGQYLQRTIGYNIVTEDWAQRNAAIQDEWKQTLAEVGLSATEASDA